jgi:hypothetical protein
MKHVTNLLLLTTTITTMALAQQPSSKTLQQEIIALEKSFALAIQTRDTLQTKRFLSDSYFLAIGVQGMPLQIIPREQWLLGLKDYVTETFSIDDIKVNIYGNTAIALLMYSQKATVRGQDRSAQFMLTDIWVKVNKSWMIAERHSSRPEMSAVTRPK